MLNEMFEGIITSVSAGMNTKKIDGVKTKEGVYRLKLESNDIDYDSVAKFNSSISSTLLNIQPMPFRAVNFGDQTVMNLDIYFWGVEEEDDQNRGTYKDLEARPDAQFKRIKIKNLTVNNKVNIPHYIFTLEIPMETDAKFLFSHLKSTVNFKFDKA
ncbi:TPA: hypothetical protein DCR49_04540 [Candidatus Delongbacteria bacterium]|nr:hypothetical protein [Candidatus Delongbacteria bacterium]